MPHCELHNVTYERVDCLECALLIWKGDKAAGCFLLGLLWPFAVLGVLLGAAYGAFWYAFKGAMLGWNDAVKWVRAKKPK